MDLFDKFITEYAELVKARGYDKEALIRYKICKNRVQEFLKDEMHANDISIDAINKRLLDKFYLTFATTVTLEKGVPIESVSKMLGHTNVRTTQIYARITERKINQDMDVLSKKLDPQTGVYIMPESEYRARKAKKLRKELQEFALANGVSIMN